MLIVGAGPVGLSAAIESNRRGFAVRIIDKSSVRTDLSKAVAINARTLGLLEPSGITPRLLAAGIRIDGINLRDEDRILTRIRFSKLPAPYNFMLSLPQSETERILEDALAERGIRIERETVLTDFTQDGNGIEANLLQDGIEIQHRADYVAGCDGAHSTVRKVLGIGFEGERYPETWSLADLHMDWPYGHGEGNLFMRSDKRLLFVISMPNGRYRAIANAPDVLSLLPKGSHIHDIHWQTEFVVSLRQVNCYGRNRAYLAGDAAHIHSPAGGRGMNLGIEDVSVLARRIDEGGLEGYSRDRHKAGRKVLRESDMMFRMSKVGNPVLRAIRNGLIRNILGSETLQSSFRLRMAGLHNMVIHGGFS